MRDRRGCHGAVGLVGALEARGAGALYRPLSAGRRGVGIHRGHVGHPEQAPRRDSPGHRGRAQMEQPRGGARGRPGIRAARGLPGSALSGRGRHPGGGRGRAASLGGSGGDGLSPHTLPAGALPLRRGSSGELLRRRRHGQSVLHRPRLPGRLQARRSRLRVRPRRAVAGRPVRRELHRSRPRTRPGVWDGRHRRGRMDRTPMPATRHRAAPLHEDPAGDDHHALATALWRDRDARRGPAHPETAVGRR